MQLAAISAYVISWFLGVPKGPNMLVYCITLKLSNYCIMPTQLLGQMHVNRKGTEKFPWHQAVQYEKGGEYLVNGYEKNVDKA